MHTSRVDSHACRWGTPWVRDIVQRIAEETGEKTLSHVPNSVAENGRWGDTGETEEIYRRES